MANAKFRKIGVYAGSGYEVFDWYGNCTTAATTQAKTVSITGFDSNSLQEGVRVVVCFTNAQTYNGAPTLNVNSTGAKTIQNKVGTSAGRYEWQAGEVVSFVYYNGYWVIENGGHASTTYWGRTKLSDTIANDSTTALTPKAVYDAGYLTLATLPIYDGSVT